MSCEDDVKALVEAGYRCNPYMGWWTKTVGSRRAEILPMPDRVHAIMYDGRERRNNIIAMSLARAIEAGDKWLEAAI
jgi:hypothetical protein